MRGDRRAHLAVDLVEEEGDQLGDVAAPLAQRRHLHRHDVEAEVEILAEAPLLDGAFERLVGGGDDAAVDLEDLAAAEAGDLALLQHAQQLGLQLERHVGDLVEQHGAALGELELARRAARWRR